MRKREYHVGCSNFTGRIYAGEGTREDNIIEWDEKADVTNEAINSVMAHMLHRAEEIGCGAYALTNRTRDGKYLRLKLEWSNHKPEWLKEEE